MFSAMSLLSLADGEFTPSLPSQDTTSRKFNAWNVLHGENQSPTDEIPCIAFEGAAA
jgi:hypothetical protein